MINVAETIEFDEVFCKGAAAYSELEEQMKQVGIDLEYLDRCCKAIQTDMTFIGFNLGYWYGKDREKYNELIKEFSMLMKGEGAGSNE